MPIFFSVTSMEMDASVAQGDTSIFTPITSLKTDTWQSTMKPSPCTTHVHSLGRSPWTRSQNDSAWAVAAHPATTARRRRWVGRMVVEGSRWVLQMLGRGAVWSGACAEQRDRDD